MQERTFRSFSTREVVLAFASFGVAIDTISRAMAIGPEQIAGVCRRAIEDGTLLHMPPQSPADSRGAMAAELVHLRTRTTELQALVAEMRRTDADDAAHWIGARLGLTKTEARVLGCLTRYGRASKQRIYGSLYAHLVGDGPEPKIVDVLVCKIRKKLTPLGVQIGTLWGYGYEITADNLALLNDAVELREAA